MTELQQVPPCKVYRPGPDGQLILVETITERPVTHLNYRLTDVRIAPKEDTIYLPDGARLKGRAAKPTAKPKKPRKERASPIRDTIAAVLVGWKAGDDNKTIAARLNCKLHTFHKRLVAARKVSSFATAEAAMKRCECGRTKDQHKPECSACIQNSGRHDPKVRRDITVEMIVERLLMGERFELIDYYCQQAKARVAA